MLRCGLGLAQHPGGIRLRPGPDLVGLGGGDRIQVRGLPRGLRDLLGLVRRGHGRARGGPLQRAEHDAQHEQDREQEDPDQRDCECAAHRAPPCSATPGVRCRT